MKKVEKQCDRRSIDCIRSLHDDWPKTIDTYKTDRVIVEQTYRHEQVSLTFVDFRLPFSEARKRGSFIKMNIYADDNRFLFFFCLIDVRQ